MSRGISMVFRVVLLFICCVGTTWCTAEGSGLPEHKHILFQGRDGAGFFACFNIAIGALDAYDSGKIAGLTIDFGESGMYYDASKGRNWWTYYFASISVGNTNIPFFVLNSQNDPDYGWQYAWKAAYELPRERCKALIDKYLHIKRRVVRRVESFIARKMGGGQYVAVQYRGTDKFGSESTSLTPKKACNRIGTILAERGCTQCKIFVATDVQPFLTLMKKKFGSRVVYLKTTRSRDGRPIHSRQDLSGYTKGMDALVDCLLLARATVLIRTASNLSNAALLFNPTLDSVLLNRSFWPDR